MDLCWIDRPLRNRQLHPLHHARSAQYSHRLYELARLQGLVADLSLEVRNLLSAMLQVLMTELGVLAIRFKALFKGLLEGVKRRWLVGLHVGANSASFRFMEVKVAAAFRRP